MTQTEWYYELCSGVFGREMEKGDVPEYTLTLTVLRCEHLHGNLLELPDRVFEKARQDAKDIKQGFIEMRKEQTND